MKLLFLLVSLLVLSLGAACNVIPQPAPAADATQPPSGGAAAPLPTETQPPMAGLEDEAFDQALAQAFADRDLESLRAMMGERFSFALDAFELRDVPADEAFAWLSVHTQVETALHVGPGSQFELLGSVPADKITQVVGISADGQWYRIQCSEYPNGLCWIPADPAVTEPSEG